MSDFPTAFAVLTGHPPFPWQAALYQRFLAGEFPPQVLLPTGLGKTAILAVWLLALAQSPDRLPRRLVYVVNRRTVVDQATREAERLRAQLSQVPEVAETLRRLCSVSWEPPLAISTLRGQYADNREWSADPARPAIIVGTVDMVGSRLLFGGYGVGFRRRPLHAGLLGQDVLLVHDEAHLEPAFQELLQALHAEQQRERPLRPFHIVALSATPRQSEPPFTLTPADEEHPVVRQRIQARKQLCLHAAPEEEVAERIAALALEHRASDQAILVYLRRLEDLETVARRLASETVERLTGTLRGWERDRLATENPVFARFLPPADRRVPATSGTVYLLCTSAGEVGVNLSADHLVCDLTTFESMVQRFGRVNRFGEGAARIDVVHPQEWRGENEYDIRRQRTLALLQQLQGDASPQALRRLDLQACQDAFAPPPVVLRTTDILWDAWTLTTLTREYPARPLLAPYLHGLSAEYIPDTYVAWRQEVGLITGELRELCPPEDLLEDYPPKPHELLRDRSDRVFQHLAAIARRHPEAPAWLISSDGKVTVHALRQLTDRGARERLYQSTVLLSPEVGGLSNGFLDGDATQAEDVADRWLDEAGRPRRQRLRSDSPRPEVIAGMRLIREVDLEPEVEESEAAAGEALSEVEAGEEIAEVSAGRWWRWYVRPRSADDDASKTALEPTTWEDHTERVVECMRRLISRLPLPAELQPPLEMAARFHDLGKRRTLWQRSIGNPDPNVYYAKSGRDWKPLEATRYRHELGSLLDALREEAFHTLEREAQEFVLHLIAVHHGRGRPHFPAEEIFDPHYPQEEVARQAAEVPRRFASLQRRYGRWGLAYLESLLRAADYAASTDGLTGEQRP